jgi:hypothetical protein
MINLLSKGTRVRWSAELFWLTKVVSTSKKFEKRWSTPCHLRCETQNWLLQPFPPDAGGVIRAGWLGMASDGRGGIWIGEWIYWPLIHTTRNYSTYSATANLHNTQITIAPARPSPASYVFISRFLTAASNCGALRAQVFFTYLRTELTSSPQLSPT